MPYEPIEVDGFPGFYEIPGFSTYVIAKDGRLLNRRTGLPRKYSRDLAGYYYVGLRRDDRVLAILRRHRLLCIIFKHPGVDITDLQVNHINGVKGDDSLDNLEWVTPQQNVEHAGAMGLSFKCLPVSTRNIDTGDVVRYASATECARQTELTKDAVLFRLRCGEGRVFQKENNIAGPTAMSLGANPRMWRILWYSMVDLGPSFFGRC